MAIVTLTDLYSNLQDWPGRLLEAPEGTTILTKSASKFVFRYPPDVGPYPGFTVQVTGTDFAYNAGEPVDGRMTQIRIFDGSGNLVVTIGKLGTDPIATDLSQFYANVFGTYGNDGDGVGPDPMMAWSHLLSGKDTITGTHGNDWQSVPGFGQGNDVYNMLGGDDWVIGGMGNDTIYGGDGYDVLSFDETNWSQGAPAIRGVSVNVQTGVVLDPWGGRDVVSGIEEFRGSRFNDTFVGSDTERDRFMGLRGRDTFDGGANTFAPDLTVTDYRDEVRYDSDARFGGRRGIVVDLETLVVGGSIRGTIRDGFGNLDTVIDIERVVGTRFNDIFVGSQVRNVFAGGAGVDSYDGQGGFDSINFGRETGRSGLTSGIVVDLSRASGQIRNDGYGNIETALGIESIWGTYRDDSVRGSAADEEFALYDGRDTMTGGGGSDTFVWESLGEFGDGDVVTDFQATGPGADRLAFYTPGIAGMGPVLTLVNGTAATQAGVGTFVFNSANSILSWDGDGAGGAAAVAIVQLTGVSALSASNFELWT